MPFPTDVINGDVVVIRCNGRLDMLTASRMRRAVQSLTEHGAKKLVLDFSAIPFLDTTGLGAIIGGLKSARAAGGDLRLTALGTQPSLVIWLTELDSVLPSHESAESAYPA
jgi:anti-sigma B factor antagonist